MYTVKCDNYILLDTTHNLLDATLDMAMNTAGEFKFTIDSSHPNFGKIKLLKSVIDVYNGTELRWSGRPISIDINWQNQYIVTCEGELAYLNDVLVRPFSFPLDGAHTTPADYFAYLINQFNDKIFPATRRLTLGDIQVRDPNNYCARSDTEYSSAWQLIKEGLLDIYGGYLVFRHSDDLDYWGNPAIYIDYIQPEESYAEPTGQFIKFAVNLLDIETEKSGIDVVTAIVPLGATIAGTDERLTVTSLPDEPLDWADDDDILKFGDHVYSNSAVQTYGYKEQIVVWDDVTVAANLLNKAKEFYDTLWRVTSTTRLTAVDLANVEGFDVRALHIGDIIPVESEPHAAIHGFNNLCMVKQLHINIFDAADSAVSVETSIKL